MKKVHKILNEKYESEMKRLWENKEIGEGDIIESYSENYPDLHDLSLVLLVIDSDAQVPNYMQGIYSISQVEKDKIWLGDQKMPIDFFIPGNPKYDHYKSMLEKAGIWREQDKRWELQDELRKIGNEFAKNKNYNTLEKKLSKMAMKERRKK